MPGKRPVASQGRSAAGIRRRWPECTTCNQVAARPRTAIPMGPPHQGRRFPARSPAETLAFLLAWGPTPTRDAFAPQGSAYLHDSLARGPDTTILAAGTPPPPPQRGCRVGDPGPAAVAQRLRTSQRLRADPHAPCVRPAGLRISSRFTGVGPRHHYSRGGDPTPPLLLSAFALRNGSGLIPARNTLAR
jgi:hypothetical protein